MEDVIQNQEPAQEQLQLVIDLYTQNQQHQALAKGAQLLEEFPNSVLLNNICGASNARLKQFDAAIDNYKKAIAIKPDYAEAFYNMGNVLKLKGDLESAIVSYAQAIKINPNYAEAHYNIGNLLRLKGDQNAAIANYAQAIQIRPNYAEAYNNMGTALQDKGDQEVAINCYTKAINIRSDYAEAYSNMGNALQDKGELETAISWYKKAIAIQPDFAEVYYNMGNALQFKGGLCDAIESYKKAINIRPTYAEAYSSVGEAYLTIGNYTLSADFYEISIVHFANNPRMREKTQNMLLKTLYFLKDKPRFLKHLNKLNSLGQKNSVIGSFSCRAAARYGLKIENGFCRKPMDYVLEKSLLQLCDFEKTLLKPARKMLDSDNIIEKKQPLLRNGHQTAGNIFATENYFSSNVKDLIVQEIEHYRNNFIDSLEGLIKNWPAEYTLYGWLVSMKSGGSIRPHMHENGWISGSIYINVPRSSKKGGGNLVLCIEDPEYLADETAALEKIVDVQTGSLCLFPSSLLHHTIPFESLEDRIVLAFDVIAK